MRHLIFTLLFLFGLGAASPALAWGDSGHRTVCEIALRNLTPTARSEVARLLRANSSILGANPLNAEFGWACTYPDHPASGGPGRRGAEHFVNYPRSLPGVTATTGCAGAQLCVVSAVSADLAILRSPAASDSDRAAALVYLGHWLGDIHQPLHSSFQDDQGGNEIRSTGLCTSSLHSTWDTCILQTRVTGRDPAIDTIRLLAAVWSLKVSDEDRARWLSTLPWQWSAESYAVTIRSELGYCVMVQSTCQYSESRPQFAQGQGRSVAIDEAYMDRAMPIIQLRITQAGVRLAHLINLALDPVYRGAANGS